MATKGAGHDGITLAVTSCGVDPILLGDCRTGEAMLCAALHRHEL